MNQILKPSIDKNDFIECEYCNNKLYRKTIEWDLYGAKRTIALDYERCDCKDAHVYWNEYDLKKVKDNRRRKKARTNARVFKKSRKNYKEQQDE